MSLVHRAVPSFRSCYHGLPEDVRRRADKQFQLLVNDPAHPSVQLKPVGKFWSARVTDAYRAFCLRDENTLVWFWLGTHDEYERLLKS